MAGLGWVGEVPAHGQPQPSRPHIKRRREAGLGFVVHGKNANFD